MSYSGKIVARWKWYRNYKRRGFKADLTITSQAVGKDYSELTKKLKEELLTLYGLPWLDFLGLLIGIIVLLVGINEQAIVYFIGGLILVLSLLYLIFATMVERFHARSVLKGRTVISKDYIKAGKTGKDISLFRDILDDIEKNEEK